MAPFFDPWLGQAEPFDEVADGALALQQQVEHGPAVRVDESGPGPVVHGLNMPLQAYVCQGI